MRETLPSAKGVKYPMIFSLCADSATVGMQTSNADRQSLFNSVQWLLEFWN
jgi:hypothetical protein